MDVSGALLSLSLALTQLSEVMHKGIPIKSKASTEEVHLVATNIIKDKSRICWLIVPGEDKIRVSLNQKYPKGKLNKKKGIIEPGVISYVDPISYEPLPGLFDSGNQAVREWLYKDIVDRNLAFEYVMGMSEEKFRGPLGALPGTDVEVIKAYVNKAKNHLNKLRITFPPVWQKMPALPEKNFSAIPVSELRDKYFKSGSSKIGKKKTSGRLFIIKKSELGYKADIRYLQAHFPGSVFQIASTFSCMEGGVRLYEPYLNEMNDKAVQGENAVLATISGAIVRRYCIEPRNRNLLRNVASIFHGAGNDVEPSIGFIRGYKKYQNEAYQKVIDEIKYNKDLDSKIEKSTALHLGLSGAIKVGLHTNVFVTSGSWGEDDISIPRVDRPQDRTVPAFDKRIDEPHPVYQIFASAININDKKYSEYLKQGKYAIPKIALRAAYEGAILAAWNLLPKLDSVVADFLREDKRPRVFLTLVGAGAFGNEPEWIVEILERLQALIAISGLQIGLIVWDENKKIGALNDRLNTLVNRIEAGNIEELSKHARLAGERLWLFNGDSSFRSKSINSNSAIIVPFKTQDKPAEKVVLGILQNFIK